jgi:MurE/MurF fusion protein
MRDAARLEELVLALRDGGFAPTVRGGTSAQILDVQIDSRRVAPGALFVALTGAVTDGHAYLDKAVSQGAAAVLVETDWAGPVPSIQVSDTRRALAHVSAAFFDHPGRKLKVVGLTGTNGKTTTCWILESIAAAAGLVSGVVGTLNSRYAGVVVDGVNTTPPSVELQRLLAKMVAAGVDVVFLEVSSHALDVGRVLELPFDVAGFLNLSQDHLDFHGDMASYFAAKERLFSQLLPQSVAAGKNPIALLNVGDEWGAKVRVPGNIERREFDVADADVRLTALGCSLVVDGTRFDSPLLGAPNAENTLAAIGVARALGICDDDISRGLAQMAPPPGRLQRIDGQGPLVVVDYAHTPDAVAKASAAIASLVPGRLIGVLGCGGDRDRGKRPKMGAAIAENSAVVFATNDNPRGEDPAGIVSEMVSGIPESTRVVVELSRRRAIARAVAMAGATDAVIIAGKGHETYQEVRGVRYPLSDVEEAQAAMAHPAGRRLVETLSPADIAGATGGTLSGVEHVDSLYRDRTVGVVTDSRKVEPGSVFFALRGERFDGHAYVPAVAEAGAVVVVVEELCDAPVAQIVVADTTRALGDLARQLLMQARTARPEMTVIAITGSNGKTTTKELTAALATDLLGVPAHAVHKNPGNFNNWIGVPLTVFELRWGHEIVILEMGANAPGEIAWLVDIGRPDIGVLTSVTDAHLEGFGSRAGVLAAKSELFAGMGPDRVAVLPAPLAGEVETAARKLVVAEHGPADVTWARRDANIALRVDSDALRGTMAQAQALTGTVDVVLPLLGEHNRQNLALAFAAIVSAGRIAPDRVTSGDNAVELEHLRLPTGRLRAVAGAGDFAGVRVLDDCYNANPGSMDAGLKVAKELADHLGGRAIAVLGDMLELGNDAGRLHKDVGARAAQLGITGLIGFGPLSADTVRGGRAHVAAPPAWQEHHANIGDDDVKRVVATLALHVSAGDVVLVKGSRGMRMERIVSALAGEGA